MANILILISKTGGGHLSLAEAVRDRLAGDHAVQIADPQPRVVHWHYRLVSRYALWLWAAEFKTADTPARSLRAHKIFTALFARGVGALLERSRPDLVMTTYSFLTYAVTQAMKRIGRACPFVILFADPNSLHQAWLSEPNVAAAFAPTRETFNQALAAGFAAGRLHLTGWPVRRQFYTAGEPADDAQARGRERRDQTRAATLAALQLDPARFTIFLQGGAEGAARFAQTAAALLEVNGVQVILAAGTNHRLFNQFDGPRSRHIRPLRFTQNIAPYMAAADVIMGKAGPNMLFESVTLGKPFVATTYIPGQEEVNLEFIQRHGLGWVALTAAEQRSLVQKLLAEPARLAAMAQTVHAYREWNTAAAESIGPLMEGLVKR